MRGVCVCVCVCVCERAMINKALTRTLHVLLEPLTVESQIIHFELASPITSVDLYHGLELLDVGTCGLSIHCRLL
jgi:hypothetical protein